MICEAVRSKVRTPTVHPSSRARCVPLGQIEPNRKKAVQKGYDMRATRLFAYAQRLAAQDRLEDALAMFERIAALQAGSAGLYLHWGLTLSEANRLDAAVDRLQQAIASTPTNVVLPLFLGQIL